MSDSIRPYRPIVVLKNTIEGLEVVLTQAYYRTVCGMRDIWRRILGPRTFTVEECRCFVTDNAHRFLYGCVVLKTDSDDGVIRPGNTVDLYVQNGGKMGLSDLFEFGVSFVKWCRRPPNLHPISVRVPMSEMEDLGIVIHLETLQNQYKFVGERDNNNG